MSSRRAKPILSATVKEAVVVSGKDRKRGVACEERAPGASYAGGICWAVALPPTFNGRTGQ